LATKVIIAEIHARIDQQRRETKAQIENLRQEIRAEIQKCKADLIKWLIGWLFGMFIAQAGLIVALARVFVSSG